MNLIKFFLYAVEWSLYFAHRILQTLLYSQDENPHILFEVEFLAKHVQTLTGVEIHPHAKLGISAIDHGHGTVIGQTVKTGDRVFIYHGVTLGASKKTSTSCRRHPRLGSDIFLANNAQVLGPSILGDHTKLGAGSKVIDSIIGSHSVLSPGVIVFGVEVPPNVRVLSVNSGNHHLKDLITKEEKVVRLPSPDFSKME